MEQVLSEASAPAQLGERVKPRSRLSYRRRNIACAHCRHRKIRCLLEPGVSVCTPCHRKKQGCIFNAVPSPTRPRRADTLPQDGNTTERKTLQPSRTNSIQTAVPEVAVPVRGLDQNDHHDQHSHHDRHGQVVPDGPSMYSYAPDMLAEPAAQAAITVNAVAWPTSTSYFDVPAMSTAAPGVGRYTSMPVHDEEEESRHLHYDPYQVQTPPDSLQEQLPSYTLHHTNSWQDWVYPPPPL